ncbi:hypothetical protein GCM10009800_19440 [Nocardiopsis rhodophaea]
MEAPHGIILAPVFSKAIWYSPSPMPTADADTEAGIVTPTAVAQATATDTSMERFATRILLSVAETSQDASNNLASDLD